ncbi:MAG: hypothetical protein ACI9KE_005487 [Polyangiales bacterium]|jgi:hypothetical protein
MSSVSPTKFRRSFYFGVGWNFAEKSEVREGSTTGLMVVERRELAKLAVGISCAQAEFSTNLPDHI